MAGGKSKRMCSNIPKFLHKINENEMIHYILNACIQIKDIQNIYMIISPSIYEDVKYLKKRYLNKILFIFQKESLGTGHAIQTFVKTIKLKDDSKILILNADMPYIQYNILQNFINQDKYPSLIGAELENANGYGRLLLNNQNHLIKIEEDKDCQDKTNKKVNMGIYLFTYEQLKENIFSIQNKNQQKEYYLTDIIPFFQYFHVYMLLKHENKYFQGVNTPEEFEYMIKLMSRF
jgi:bifunctional UDP-N-acetylglucosamine pyrophosphorylase/glucosamine-1-phosphate N-acetyltransferase